jgi:hypothetical protein
MKKKEAKTVTAEVVTAIVCNLCGQELVEDGEGGPVEYATIGASWGYNSTKDGQVDEAHACEPCYDTRIAPLFMIAPIVQQAP